MSHDNNDGRALRVLMVVPHYPPPVRGGSEKQAGLLARALAEAGHAVLVVSRRFDARQGTAERIHGCDVVRLSFGTGLFAIFNELYQVRIPFWMFSRRRDFDIVHVHTIRIAGILALLTAKALGRKTVQKIPDVGVFGITESCQRLFGAMRSRVFRMAADAVVTMSENSVRAMEATGYPETRLLRVTNGVLPSPGAGPNPGPAPGLAVRGGARIRILFLGRLAPKKGLLDLLDAWELVLAAVGGNAAEVRIYGQGPMESCVRAALAAKSLAGSVALCGYAGDVGKVLAESDLMVLPSYEEGNSNSVLEAMAAGVPVISTRVGGTAHLVGKAGSAFLHEPGDIRALSEMLIRLIRDEGLRRETGARMRERSLQHFSMESIRDRYIAAYRLLLDGGRDRIGDCSQFPPD